MAEGTRAAIAALALLTPLTLAGCSSGTAELEDQLAAVTAERDALQAQVDAMDARHDATVATLEAIDDVLAANATEPAVSRVEADLAQFVAQPTSTDYYLFARLSFEDDLYSLAPEAFHTVGRWVDPHGTTAGTLWVETGTAWSGDPMQLVGVSVVTFDDDGLIVRENTYTALEGEALLDAIHEGTPTDIYGAPWGEADG